MRVAGALVVVVMVAPAAGCGSASEPSASSPRAAVSSLLTAAEDNDAGAACAVSRGELALGCDGQLEEAAVAEASTALEHGVRWSIRPRGDTATATLRRAHWQARFELVRRHRRWVVRSWQSFSSSS